MKPILLCVLAALVCVAIGPVAAQPQEDSVRVRPLYSDVLPLGGRDAPRAVAYETWHLAPGVKTERTPRKPGAALVLELASGKLATLIDGAVAQRRVGEFFVVQPQQTLTLVTQDDSVVIWALQIQAPR